MITIADLDRLGVTLHDGWVVAHDYLDRDVPPEAAVSQPALDPASACTYRLQNWNSLLIEVHQAPYNSAEDVEFASGRAARKQADVRAEDGLSLARWHDTDSWDIDLWRSGLLVQVSLTTDKPGPYGPFDAKTFATKLEPLVKAAVLTGPTAPMRHSYPAPFDRLKHPCEIAGTEAFYKSFPSTHSAAAVKTQFHPRHAMTPMDRHPESALQGGMLCKRHNLVPDGVTNRAEYRELDLTTRFWDNPQAAADRNAYQCDPLDKHPAGPPVAVSPTVGTGETCMTDLQINWALDLRLDNVNISLTAALGDHKLTAGQRRDQLLPAAQAIAAAGAAS